jgi:hypothetical protein
MFAGCTSLTSVNIPSSITSIGEYAFNPSGLTSVSLSRTPTTITFPSDAFPSGLGSTIVINYCDVSFEYTISNNQAIVSAYIGPGGFVTIPSSVTVTDTGVSYPVVGIKSNAFWGFDSLFSITIPSSVTSIGDSAFAFCSSLTYVTIPSSVTSIAGYAFYGCSSLTSVTIPNSVTSIGNDTFANCSSVTSVTIPSSVTSIGNSAFAGCSSLTSITIPSSVTSIGTYAFNPSGLGNVFLSSTTTLYSSAFPSTANLYYTSGDYQYTLSNNQATITGYTGAGGAVSIPNTLNSYPVVSIGPNAFANCSSVTSVTIPSSVTSIGNYAFNPSGLGNVYLPALTTFPSSAFPSTAYLYYTSGDFTYFISNNQAFINTYIGTATSVTIPTSITVTSTGASYPVVGIGDNAFANCSSVTSVTIPSSVTSIGNYAFNPSGLGNVYLYSTTTTFPSSAFPSTAYLYYTSGDYTYFISNNQATIYYYSGAGGAVSIPNTLNSYPVVSIGTFAFAKSFDPLAPYSPLTSVTIPNSVSSIGNYAFNNCTSLTSATIPSSVTSFGDYAFNPSGLGNVYLSSTTPFGSTVFPSTANLYYTSGDYQYTLSNNQATITRYTGAGGAVSIPNTLNSYPVVSIGTYAFANCSSVTSVTIPSSVTSIGDYAFNPSGLGDVYLYSTTTFPSSAFPSTALLYYTSGDYQYTLYDNQATITRYTGAGGAVSIPNTFNSCPVVGIWPHAFQYCTSLTSVTIPSSVTSIGFYAFNPSGLGNVYLSSTTTFPSNAFPSSAVFYWGSTTAMATQAQLATTQAALATTQAGLATTQADLASLKAELAGIKARLETLATKTELTSSLTQSRTDGVNSVLSNPNLWTLYTTSQIQNMAVGDLLLSRQVGGGFVLNYDIEQSTDLQTWTPYQALSLPLNGLPTDKAFVRIKAKQ